MPDQCPPDVRVQDWVCQCLDFMEVQGAEVCVRIVDSLEIQSLNRQFRGKDKPTNVLSFAGSRDALTGSDTNPGNEPAVDENGRLLLGDVIICQEVLLQESLEQKKALDAHFVHLLIHGLLHLQGYDHSVDDQATEMETLEKRLMHQLGYDDPYQ